ncbi:Hypothetical_protein [Hexamita inflata]|uniref:Hypothetical_protein n=1 Tax=Hexamita inflata TaxID=28002 RepID=A0AA86Q5N1_9EUKA|nr:Hypothetical protein HINF_LOCUS38636 [Hexamita inflata]
MQQTTRKYMKVSVDMHNKLHKQLQEGTITIKEVVQLGISHSNAYHIKNYSADTVEPTSGRKSQLTNKIRRRLILKINQGFIKSNIEAQQYLKSRYNLNLDVSTVRKVLGQQNNFRGFKKAVGPNPLSWSRIFSQKQYNDVYKFVDGIIQAQQQKLHLW